MVDELAWLVGWREPGGRSASQLETLHVDHVGSKLCRSRENERPMASPRWMAGAWLNPHPRSAPDPWADRTACRLSGRRRLGRRRRSRHESKICGAGWQVAGSDQKVHTQRGGLEGFAHSQSSHSTRSRLSMRSLQTRQRLRLLGAGAGVSPSEPS